jgi:predicted nucleic acid-binding protein
MLVDTSVWIEHLAMGSPRLVRWLEEGEVWCHPFVVGELAGGRMKNRREVLSLLGHLPATPLASHGEVMALLEGHELMGRGLGWVDLHLLASALLAETGLWTLDRRLAKVAHDLGVGALPRNLGPPE